MLVIKTYSRKDFENKPKSAPDVILKELKNNYLNENGTLPFFDVEEVINNEIDKNNKNAAFHEKIKSFLERYNNCISISNDNLATYSCFNAFSSKFDNAGLVLFDAHPCCMSLKEISAKSHIRALIENKAINKDNIIFVGLRSWHSDEYKFLKDSRLKFFGMKEISSESIEEISYSIMSVAKSFNALYASIDIDVIEPVFAPATNNPEVGGLTSRQLLFLLSKLRMLKNWKFADIVGIAPEKDLNNVTSKLCAKIISELC